MKTKSHLTIDMVSFPSYKDRKHLVEKTGQVIDISNDSVSDILIFPGYTLFSENELILFRKNCTNTHSLIFLEVCDGNTNHQNRKFLLYQNGKIIKDNLIQQFVKSSEVEKNPNLIDEYVDILEKDRIHHFKGSNILLVICGEINFLKNIQNENNRVVIRTNNASVRKRYKELVSNTCVFINPQHTPLGNQGKLKKRREYLSKKGRIYCSTTNLKTGILTQNYPKSFKGTSLQYLVKDGKPIEGEILNLDQKYLLKRYSV